MIRRPNIPTTLTGLPSGPCSPGLPSFPGAPGIPVDPGTPTMPLGPYRGRRMGRRWEDGEEGGEEENDWGYTHNPVANV